MNKVLIVLALILSSVVSNAQEWVEHGGAEYNCAVLNGILADYGGSALQRSGDGSVTVAELFALFFPSCPVDGVAAETKPPSAGDTGAPLPLFSFSSNQEGLQPVLGPLSLPAGIYIFTATTDGYMAVSVQSLSDDCGRELSFPIFNLTRSRGADGAQTVVKVEEDCKVLLELSNTSDAWLLDIVSALSLPVQSVSSSNSFSSVENGMRPVLGPFALPAGIYIFSATTNGYMTSFAHSLSGDCGWDLSFPIFNLTRGRASSGAQTVIEVEKDCAVVLEIGNTSAYWQLEFNKPS